MSGQSTNLPEWIVWVQALAVPLLGLFAAWIAYQQWRTADRKVQLDLFDRRFALYNSARNALKPVLLKGKADLEDIPSYAEAIDKVDFLFGKEVSARFNEAREDLSNLGRYGGMIGGHPPYHLMGVNGKAEYLPKIVDFFHSMPVLIAPYMRLDHKLGGHLDWVEALRIRIIGSMERVMECSQSLIRAVKDLRTARGRRD